MLNFIKMTTERFENKVDELKANILLINRDIEDLKESNTFNDDQIRDVEKKVDDIKKKMKDVSSTPAHIPDGMMKKLGVVITDNKDIKNKLTELEDRGRRNNLRINGIEENEHDKETPLDTERKVSSLFKNELGIKESMVIERAHRSGPTTHKDGKKNYKRVIVMKFLNFKDKQRVLNAFIEKKLWQKNIYINEDYSSKTVEIRKSLFNTVKTLKSQGKNAKVVYNRIVTSENGEEEI